MYFQSLSAKAKLSLLQKEYRKFFRAELAKYKVTSPAKLNREEKVEFFNGIKKDWPKYKALIIKAAKPGDLTRHKEKAAKSTKPKAKKLKMAASDTSLSASDLQNAYREFFKRLLAKLGVTSPAELSTEDKSKFFSSIKKLWPAEKKQLQREAAALASSR